MNNHEYIIKPKTIKKIVAIKEDGIVTEECVKTEDINYKNLTDEYDLYSPHPKEVENE